MSVTTVVQTLFPLTTPPKRTARSAPANRLSHLFAIGCALIPLVAVGQAFAVSI